jgi:hypothetical protein
VGLWGGINPFSYAKGNSLSNYDPLGLFYQALGICFTAGVILYAIYKFESKAVDTGDSCMKYNKMQSAYNDWMGTGFQGSPPYTQSQLADASQECLHNTGNTLVEGAKLETKPLTAVGSIWKNLLNW